VCAIEECKIVNYAFGHITCTLDFEYALALLFKEYTETKCSQAVSRVDWLKIADVSWTVRVSVPIASV
jgi:hypothetical protein